MTESHLSIQQQRQWIRQISQLLLRRRNQEADRVQRRQTRLQQTQQEYEQSRQAATQRFQAQHVQLAATYQEAREKLLQQYESEGLRLLLEEQSSDQRCRNEHQEFLETAQTVYEDRCRRIERGFTEREAQLRQELSQFQEQCDRRTAEAQALIGQAQTIVRRRCRWPENTPAVSEPEPGFSHAVYLERAVAALQRGRLRIAELQNRPASRFVEDGWPVIICIFLILGTAYPAWRLFYEAGWFAVIAVCLGGSVGVTLVIRQIARILSRRQTLAVLPAFQAEVAAAVAELHAARSASQRAAERALRKLTKRRDRELASTTEDHQKERAAHLATMQERQRNVAAQVRSRRETLIRTQERQLKEVDEQYPHKIATLESAFLRHLEELAETYRTRCEADRQEFEREEQELTASWRKGLAEFQAAVRSMNERVADRFPAWNSLNSVQEQPSERASPGDSATNDPVHEDAFLALGHYEFDLASVGTTPRRANESTPPQESFSLPVVLSLLESPSLLLETEGAGRDEATRVLQNVMLRMLTTFPPGKVRFTIIDPVGLGQNFSAFMHLADYDERLVTNRIWTDSAHINQRLADLSEHMEDVIQKYLRNEFSSIQEYNLQAGEVAEPYHILVVANFPANFSDEAARRLTSIVSSGARCGVYTLISVDTKLRLPRNFDLADLEAQATTLVWNPEEQRFAWKYDDLQSLPLRLESPPDEERFTALVRAIGSQAKDAARVEVPFESVVPPSDNWWRGDSRQGIEVPLGRAGAKKLQYMQLGRGTSQHVLIAGKTGSGKSTLLNAMITNLAIHYSPQELHFYLIDFKKGVEFKAYAAQRLPHARVIAIESEREFGLSVLERLDLELKQRGELFRKQGAQDLKGYRNAVPDAVMPRILLVIDEFQEFFTSDDKVSHEAALLLDRLVRQGRAFGIHVLLGSQTLAGAYSLARSTLGQMAVRIALQCSESDAHLILSEDNTAARLLNRPGEAIYNDANGLFEGNHPFQVVWLSDSQRETYLRRIHDRAEQAGFDLRPPIVFEGNVAADPQENHLLQAALRTPLQGPVPTAVRAWLGSAVSIKDPTEAVFHREGGSNLLLVGQNEEMAQGILANCLVSISAQLRGPFASHKGNGNGEATLPVFFVFDGSRSDAVDADLWKRIAAHTGVPMKLARLPEAGQAMRTIGEEVERRLAAPEQSYPPLFVVVYNLARFRDLKKADDFGSLSFNDDEASDAGKHFATILREGPALGVHTLLWCDSSSNLGRWLERSALREFKTRVLFQMSANDSSNLMDSPAASRLGGHMAYLYNDEQGLAEKFRPYAIPSTDWLGSIREQSTSATSDAEVKISVGIRD